MFLLAPFVLAGSVYAGRRAGVALADRARNALSSWLDNWGRVLAVVLVVVAFAPVALAVAAALTLLRALRGMR